MVGHTYKSFVNKNTGLLRVLIFAFFIFQGELSAQTSSLENQWIRPTSEASPSVWGIRNGIVFGLWPSGIETGRGGNGGPRGLIRVGYEYMGNIYQINFIAVEPVVDGKIEFSEISPSQIDSKWGKLIWASEDDNLSQFYPAAKTRGKITHPDPDNFAVEELSLYLFMERFLNGAHPYLKLSIRSDRPEELCIETFNHPNSAAMNRCALTATMGNYSRLRKLYLDGKVIDSRELYKGFDGIDFIEKAGYGAKEMLKDNNGDFIVLASSNESFTELADWPQQEAYFKRSNWRYRPFFKLSQYWRKENSKYDPSLSVRVNGRAKYWGGGSNDKSRYVTIPGGPSFENFELREKYYPGQKFYYGITRKEPEEIIKGFSAK